MVASRDTGLKADVLWCVKRGLKIFSMFNRLRKKMTTGGETEESVCESDLLATLTGSGCTKQKTTRKILMQKTCSYRASELK